jgi:uncharacterized protein involved in exopolysaccharide biosynthesis
MENNVNKNEEIDLREIFKSIKGFFFSIWNSINNIIILFKKRFVLVLILIALGVGGGIGLFSIMPPIYISTLTLSSKALSNDFCSDLIAELSAVVEDQTPVLLAKKLRIDTAIAKKIKRIDFYNYDERLKEKYKDKDTVVLGRPFKIKVCASENTIFDTLQKALVNYLENNEYALKRKEIKKQENILMREKIITEIKELDSLKNVVTANLLPRGTQTGFVFGQPIDPIGIYKEGINYFQKELDLNKEMILIDNIQVINDFSARAKPDSPRIWKTTTAGGIAGLLLGLFLASMLEKRKKE